MANIRKSFETSKFLTSLVAVTPLLVVAAFGIFLAAEHIQAIADVERSIAVDAIVAGIAASAGIYPAFVVRLLAKEVVKVQGDNKRLVAKKRL